MGEEPFVTCEWLNGNLHREDILVVDCRYNLFDHDSGSREYAAGHIPGAHFLHMERDLTGEVGEHGGRHPLPDVEHFTAAMNRIGLREGTMVVAYDNDGSGAARLWWLLRYMGHENARILNGGFPGWKEMNFPVSTEEPSPGEGNFRPSITGGLLMGRDDLGNLERDAIIVDSRAYERYTGETEPIDHKAGHIPGAINIPYSNAIEKGGLFKPREELSRVFESAGNHPVLYCGSGITSCVSFVALWYIGKNPRLYAGSWSDWISYEENEVATGPD